MDDDEERMHQVFLRCFPITKVGVMFKTDEREFFDPDDADQYIKQIFDEQSSKFYLPILHRVMLRIEFEGDLTFVLPIDDPRQMKEVAPKGLLEQIPVEMLEIHSFQDFVRQTAMIRLMLYVYKNHVEGREILPDQFKTAFYDNILRAQPTHSGKGYEELSDDQATEFDEKMERAITAMAMEMVNNYPPALRKQLEREFDLPTSTNLSGSGYKFYNDDDFV